MSRTDANLPDASYGRPSSPSTTALASILLLTALTVVVLVGAQSGRVGGLAARAYELVGAVVVLSGLIFHALAEQD